jgi:hypothetical protein
MAVCAGYDEKETVFWISMFVAVDITSVCVWRTWSFFCVAGVVKSLFSFSHFQEDITLITELQHDKTANI